MTTHKDWVVVLHEGFKRPQLDAAVTPTCSSRIDRIQRPTPLTHKHLQALQANTHARQVRMPAVKWYLYTIPTHKSSLLSTCFIGFTNTHVSTYTLPSPAIHLTGAMP